MNEPELPRPPCVLDFEASGFGPRSYPIEVGYALSNGERFCCLIKPTKNWTFWNAEAERLHQISREKLMDVGRSPADVCAELNDRLSGRVLYSDAWVFDDAWLQRLFQEAHRSMNFKLSAIENILSECQYRIWDSTRDRLLKDQRDMERHRASADAELIQRVFLETEDLCCKKAS